MNVAELLENWAKKFPDKPAIIFQDKAITFSQLRNNSFKLSNALLDLGLKKSDRVAIFLPNRPEYIYSYVAIFTAGLVAVPLDFMLTEDELLSCLNHSEARVLIAQAKEGISLDSLKKKLPCLEKIILSEEFNRILSQTKLTQIPQVSIRALDHSMIIYSSGTTGRPKGILWNYRHLDSGSRTMAHFVEINEDYILLCCLPFSHGGGLVYFQCLLSFAVTIVLMEHFIPLEFLKNIARYKVNAFFIVPSMYYALLSLKELEGFDLSSLKWINCFGAASSAEALRRFHKICPQAVFYNGWGMMETAPPNVILPTGSNKIESIGKPAPWFKVKIADNKDKQVKVGQVGQLLVKGWPIMEGYYKEPELSKEVMRGGWLHTGDLAKMDKAGFIYILGRVTERIKVGGLLVYASEVEAAILRHPRIREVAVIGVPDKLRGEVPEAFVVSKNGSALSADKLRYFCRKHLAHFKIPRYFEFMPSLPKTRTGKIDKQKLKSEFV
jgi:acyl-CoA synthetase (AMP-forming)/AMP-acid ligase II